MPEPKPSGRSRMTEARSGGRSAVTTFRGPVTFTTEDLLRVGSFIAYHDDRYMMGGYTAAEAWAAFCRMMGFDQEAFRAAVRPGEGDEEP